MKCIDCGKDVANWPAWLEHTGITVRCSRCSNAGAVPINMPKGGMVLPHINELSERNSEPANVG